MLTQKRLKDLLCYNPNTGVFVWWVNRRGTAKAGDKAGYIAPDGYRRIGVDGKSYKASRLAWLFMTGYFPEHDVDHINRVRCDDRWANLRHVSHQCNLRNIGNRCDNTSGIKGVCWHRLDKKWMAQIKVNYKNHNLGYYDDFDNAVCARLAAEQCLGWRGCDSSSPAFKHVQGMLSTNQQSS